MSKQTRTGDDMITLMYNELKRYAKGKNVNPAAVKAKELFIQEWQEIVTNYENEREMLQKDIERMIKNLVKMKNQIIKLEAICFIHGIDDLPMWMAKDVGALVDDVRFNQKFNITQIPDRLLDNEAWRQFYQEEMNKVITEKN